MRSASFSSGSLQNLNGRSRCIADIRTPWQRAPDALIRKLALGGRGLAVASQPAPATTIRNTQTRIAACKNPDKKMPADQRGQNPIFVELRGDEIIILRCHTLCKFSIVMICIKRSSIKRSRIKRSNITRSNIQCSSITQQHHARITRSARTGPTSRQALPGFSSGCAPKMGPHPVSVVASRAKSRR
jgi:hypothetical protein